MAKKDVNIKDVIQEKDKNKRDQLYNDYVEKVTPKHNCLVNIFWAFITGGSICTFGQFITNILKANGVEKEAAASYTTLILILLSIIFTGLNLYQKFALLAGAGSVVPVTGFANSVASPAIEFNAEGQVFGIGCKIFTIAGPVILYGIFSSWVLGFIYWALKILGVM